MNTPTKKMTAAAFAALLALGGTACNDEDNDGSTADEETEQLEQNVEEGADEVEQQVDEGAEEPKEGQQ
ncbi:MAG TPA: hypothetical protein VGR26_17560 [Acidimicrobiales bacterium]|nr:hypothetical protein [Acidimicrobiales bacterium]